MTYTFTKDGLKDGLKNYLTELVPSALDAGPNALKAKWDQREAVYECDKKYAGPRLFDNVEPYPYDVLGPIVRQVKDTIMAALTGPQTYCQAIPLGRATQEAADVVERGVQDVLDEAGIERTLDQAVYNCLICGVGFLRARMDADGLHVERIHPGDFVCAVHKGGRLKDAGVVGHRFYIPYWLFCQRVEDGAYPMLHERGEGEEPAPYEGDLKRFIGVRATDEPVGFDTSRNPANQPTLTSDQAFEDVRLYELLVRMKVEGDDTKTPWYRVVWSDEATEAILCEPYPYPDPWYIDIRLHDEEVFWPVQSLAGRVLPQAMHQSQMLNAAVTATLAGINRPVMATGVLGQKIKTWRMGQLLQGNMGGKFEPLPFDYDGTALLAFTEENDNRMNKSAGTTEQALSGEVLQSKTATEVEELAEGRQKSEGAKSRFVGDFVEELFGLVHKLCLWHARSVVRPVYGDVLDERFFPALRAKYKWRMAGRAPGSSGPVLIAKLEQVLRVAMAPGSPYHAGRVVEAIVNALNIADVETLKKTPDEIRRENMAREAEAQAQLMGMAAGGKGAPGKPPAMAEMAPTPNGQAQPAGLA